MTARTDGSHTPSPHSFAQMMAGPDSPIPTYHAPRLDGRARMSNAPLGQGSDHAVFRAVWTDGHSRELCAIAGEDFRILTAAVSARLVSFRDLQLVRETLKPAQATGISKKTTGIMPVRAQALCRRAAGLPREHLT